MPDPFEGDTDEVIAARLAWYAGWCTDQATEEHGELSALLLEAKDRLLTLSRANIQG